MIFNRKTIAGWFLFALLGAAVADAENASPVPHTKKDKCPICGMFVHKFPDWVAHIVFTDGVARFFDGAKDMLKYYYLMEKYDPGKKRGQIERMFVKDYYTLEHIDATKAWYVYDSDVYGPMGRELIPHSSEESAMEFMRDHGGSAVLRFSEITKDKVLALDVFE